MGGGRGARGQPPAEAADSETRLRPPERRCANLCCMPRCSCRRVPLSAGPAQRPRPSPAPLQRPRWAGRAGCRGGGSTVGRGCECWAGPGPPAEL
eukprot:14207960-Alexandrium_andersonii.AAC.1